MNLQLPALSLVVLMGPSGSGKSTFARKHFAATEVLSSDALRGWVSDDENDQSASQDAFESLHFLAAKRLSRGKLTVIDATNVQAHGRAPLLALAKQFHVLPSVIVLDVPERLCHERNAARPERNFGPHVVRNQLRDLRQSLHGLKKEGFRNIWTLTPEDLDSAQIQRVPLWNDKRDLPGPFDIIGDVHGCDDELAELITSLGYAENGVHPDGRTLVFLGDLIDRGPKIPEVLDRVMGLVNSGRALCVPGNHEAKLLRKLAQLGKAADPRIAPRHAPVKLTHGLAETMAQFATRSPEWVERTRVFLDRLISHYVLAEGKLVVSHAGLPESMHGRSSGRVREFALYGDTTGEIDAYGLPVRYPWADDYRGRALVVYGHTPVVEPAFVNNTICVDSGCVFGGALTALRWPERTLVSVPAAREYYAPTRPLAPEPVATPSPADGDLLDITDLLGRSRIETRLMRTITIGEAHAAAALEAMARFTVDPRWLVYLPPTMSPCETSEAPGLLEHPAEAIGYYRKLGVQRVICEEKHMGSRAVLVLAKDAAAAQRRFHVGGTEHPCGVIVTRTGRPFFSGAGGGATEAVLLERVRCAVDWAGLQTDWVVLDAEIMPWTAKARELVRDQYAAVGAAATAGLTAADASLRATEEQARRANVDFGPEFSALVARVGEQRELADRYNAAWRQYAGPADGVDDLRIAVFHVLASEGHVHADRDHGWHMAQAGAMAASLSGSSGVETLQATRFIEVDTADPEPAVAWWQHLTANGAEGMVVKPWTYITTGPKGLVQPAIKCRGPEYLRIIYGLDYTLPANLQRLRKRGLGAKRSLALREFALGVEGLERFVAGDSLRRVHECVFGVLALESEPVDPRL